jgi:hypothetical protein
MELMVADVRALMSLTMGVKKGSVVAIISRNNVEWAACAFATWGLGAVYVPMPEMQVFVCVFVTEREKERVNNRHMTMYMPIPAGKGILELEAHPHVFALRKWGLG